MRRVMASSGTIRFTTLSISTPICSRASPWAIVRGIPSRIKPFAQSGSARRSFTMPTITSSGTRAPASIKPFAFLPIGVPSLTAARRMLPVEMVGMPSLSQRISAWVPLPAPGAPKRISFIAHSLSLIPRTLCGNGRSYSLPENGRSQAPHPRRSAA